MVCKKKKNNNNNNNSKAIHVTRHFIQLPKKEFEAEIPFLEQFQSYLAIFPFPSFSYIHDFLATYEAVGPLFQRYALKRPNKTF